MAKPRPQRGVFGLAEALNYTRVPITVQNNIKSPGRLTSKEVKMVLRRTTLDTFGLKALSKLRNRILIEIPLIWLTYLKSDPPFWFEQRCTSKTGSSSASLLQYKRNERLTLLCFPSCVNRALDLLWLRCGSLGSGRERWKPRETLSWLKAPYTRPAITRQSSVTSCTKQRTWLYLQAPVQVLRAGFPRFAVPGAFGELLGHKI